MHKSESINELATALSKAQGEITGALKDSANPFFKSKYSDLASCWDACRAALTKHGLAVVQFPMTEGADSFLHTVLTHSSGQYIGARLILKSKDDTSQAMGSAITYARRYALCAVVGVAQVDDDGNFASGRANSEIHSPKGDMGKNIDPAKAKATADHMSKLMMEDIIGDHDGIKRAMIILDYHEKVLNVDEDLYVAVGDMLPTAKKNAWKAYVSQAKKAEAADRATDPSGRR